jgi:hypothetical protein
MPTDDHPRPPRSLDRGQHTAARVHTRARKGRLSNPMGLEVERMGVAERRPSEEDGLNS